MDIGLNSDEDMQALVRAKTAVDSLESIFGDLPENPVELALQGSDLEWVIENIPDPLVDPRLTIYDGLATAKGNLWQIFELFDPERKTTALALQTLLRAALLSAARVVYPALSNDRPEFLRRTVMVMAQEGNSLRRFYADASKFEELIDLIPPADIVENQDKRFANLGVKRREILSDSALLREVAKGVANGEIDSVPGAEVILRENYSWLFHRLSGVAHGFAWPRLVPGTDSMSGHFVSDLAAVSDLAWLAGHEVLVKAGRVS